MELWIFLSLVVVVAAATGEQVVPCSQSLETGSCRSAELSWYYSAADRTCQSFIYSGCGGNENRFSSLSECSRTCCPDGCEDPCDQPMKKGPCQRNFTRYYYSANGGECLQFEWGGCFPNANNFKTLAGCQQKCEGK